MTSKSSGVGRVVSVRISLNSKFERPLRRIAKEHGISFSDIMNEISEWVLDQEVDFRRDLALELGEVEEEDGEEDDGGEEDDDDDVDEDDEEEE